MSSYARSSLIHWKPRGPRLLTATFQTVKLDIKLYIVVGYAQINDLDLLAEDEFIMSFKIVSVGVVGGIC